MKTITVRATSAGHACREATARVLPTDNPTLAAASRAAIRLYKGGRTVMWSTDGVALDRRGEPEAKHYRGTVCGRSLSRKLGGGTPVLGECFVAIPIRK